MKLLRVEVIVRGRYQHGGTFTDDTRFTYTTIAKPQTGDVLNWEGKNIEIGQVVEVLKSLTDGSGTTYTTDYFRVWA